MAKRILLPGRFAGWAIAVALVLVVRPSPAAAQVGRLVSPGPLSKAHATLEGLSNCQKCHEAGRQVTANRCLSCHAPVAERIRERRGVHRDAKGDRVTCHVEHAGVDAELRPFDRTKFDHARDTGFALDGRHAPVATDCVRCHKGRSFLEAKPACASCHTDPHKTMFGPTCTSCHTTEAWETRTVDHARTTFPLKGRHADVACATCHQKPPMAARVKADRCADCHTDPHRGQFKQDCGACHQETGFRGAPFDHAKQTRFPLAGWHAALACSSCHKGAAPGAAAAGRTVDFRGASTTCAACHVAQEPRAPTRTGRPVDGWRFTPLSRTCATCHQASDGSWAQGRFTHTWFPITSGKHAGNSCSACHNNPTSYKVFTCLTCHDRAKMDSEHRGRPGYSYDSQACYSCHPQGRS